MVKRRVIVIDDEEDIVSLICDFLELGSFQVVGTGYDGSDAISLFESTTPDIVIMDYHMPKFNADVVLEKIRNEKQNTIVMIMSSDVTISSNQKLLKMRPDSIIIKPFDMLKIQKTLEDLISNPILYSNS